MKPRLERLAVRRRTNAVMLGLTAACAAFALAILAGILGYILFKGFSSLSWTFMTELPAPVGETGGGIGHAILGSLKILSIASVFGIPVGVLGAVYLAEYGDGRTAFWIRYAADVLNGVPSIVMGIFAYTVVVLPMKRFSAFAGGVALAVIMVPIVLRNTEEFLRLVPGTLREAALALGVPRWKVLLRIVLPTAAPGILTGVLLAVSRVAGETAPLIFTAFGNRYWSDGLFEPTAALPLTIYIYAISPYPDWHRQAWAAAALLLILLLAINVTARVWLRPKAGATT